MDVFGGLCVFLFVKNRTPLWRMVQKFSEYIANSWKEWHVGRVRLINHGLYTGIGTLTGIFIVGTLIGKEQLSAIFIVALTSMICAALWAQLIEGSAKLLRPLGFYGGVLGIVIGGLLVQVLFGTDFFLILAAFSVAAPWIQGLGRLRCLVQGCCHGRVISPNIGIKYFHARSRVVRLANLKNAYLHPTQVYSILTNVVVAIVLAKLWFSNVPLPLLSGIYLILSGLGRFVEEAYRGEPQTPILRGLRLYQWLALIGIIAGAFFTVIPHPMNPSKIQFSMEVLFISLVLGLLALFLTGVDFPNSNRRFSRLV
ncbi:MAG: prolipoprotein diacylglyceryl transferase family protein [bacterium]